jgi:type IV pilus assembly protein PilV
MNRPVRDLSRSRQSQAGSFILEALVSVLIFSLGIIALMGMAAQAINQVGQTKYRNDASNLAGELIGQMWVSASNLSDFAIAADDPYTNCPASNAQTSAQPWLAKAKGELPQGCATIDVVGTKVDIDISWADKKNEGVRHHYFTTAEIAKNS